MTSEEVEEMIRYRDLIVATRNSHNDDGKTLGEKILEMEIKQMTESVSSLKKEKTPNPRTQKTAKVPRSHSASLMSKVIESKSTSETTEELGDLAGRVYRVDTIGKGIEDVVYIDKGEKKRTFQIMSIVLTDPLSKGSIQWSSVGQENAKKLLDWAL
jgi:hypothetical protein